jgi:LysR family hydrogen peroxide-inducible transcriptional activator
MHFGSHPITLRQLQYIVAVAREGSFRQAAERCFVSQPSLSAQVAEIERVLGIKLFERNRRRVLITEAGHALVERAEVVLLRVEDLIGVAQQHVDPLVGVLRLGVIPTVGPYLVPELDPALRSAFPDLSLRWREDKTDTLVEMLNTADLDAAVLALVTSVEHLDHAVLTDDPFVLAVPPTHPLGTCDSPINIDTLPPHEVLLLDEGHCFRDQALELCGSIGATELGFRATSLSTLVQMVAGGQHMTLLPQIAVEVENRHGRLTIRPFDDPSPRRTLALVWRPTSPIADALRKIAAVGRASLDAARASAPAIPVDAPTE